MLVCIKEGIEITEAEYKAAESLRSFLPQVITTPKVIGVPIAALRVHAVR